MMTNGLALYESYQFKRMIHGIHSNSKRASPFTHGNALVGVFNKDGSSATGGTPLTDSCGRSIGSFGVCLTPPGTVAALSTVENYAVEVTWPGVSLNCSACHIDSSYKTDMGTLGAVVKKPIDVVTGVTTTDPNTWLVISPKSATCTSCHDGKTTSGQSVVNHVIQFGGAAFGDKSQFDIAMAPRETCDDCHTNGGAKNVDIDHGQK
jgi:OmcA/MtrC family decaheme c-type cytochrome